MIRRSAADLKNHCPAFRVRFVWNTKHPESLQLLAREIHHQRHPTRQSNAHGQPAAVITYFTGKLNAPRSRVIQHRSIARIHSTSTALRSESTSLEPRPCWYSCDGIYSDIQEEAH